jgi:ABC-type iron transport system FetAB ATPase subunit
MLALEAIAARGLAPLDLAIADGECVAVSGPSGAGKTVLLRAVADLDPNAGDATAGAIRRSGVPAPRWRQAVGFLAAEPGWWADRVGDHFADASASQSADGPEGPLGDLLDALGLPGAALDWTVRNLSTGERQRLALARLLQRGAQVLLLDEPTGALDPESTERVEALMRARLENGASVLIVTHDAAQADRLARRRLRVADGAVTEAAA